MKIVFFEARHDSFYGAQQSLLTLFSGLRSTAPGAVKAVLVTTGEGPLSHAFRDAGHEVVVLPSGARSSRFGGAVLGDGLGGRLRTGLEMLRYNLRLRRWLLDTGVDLVYANNARSMMFCGPAALAAGLPRLWYVRGDQRVRGLFAAALRLSNRVVLIAEALRSVFTPAERSRFSERFRVLNTGFDVTHFARPAAVRVEMRRKLGVPDRAFVVGMVGSISARKGHDLLVPALDGLMNAKTHVHALIVGGAVEGSEQFAEDLKAQTAVLAPASRWHWLGYRQDIADCYAAMDLLVLPSRAEGLPRTVVEALAAGLPVVASAAGASRQLLGDARLGQVVEPLTVESLQSAMTDAIQRADGGSASRAFRQSYVQDNLSIEAYVNGFLTIARELVNDH